MARDLSCFRLVLSLATLPTIFCSVHSAAMAEDWNQWRGPERTGYAADAPQLIQQLPEAGLKPVWTSGKIDSARDGGWGSPIVSDGIVYLFTHKKELVGEKPGPKQFPWLAPNKRTGMSDEEYAEYEKNRRNEDETRAKAYQFREFVRAYDARTGEELWVNQSDSTYTRFPQSGCPTVVGDQLFILGAGRVARCLNAKTGQELWKTPLPGEFRDEYYQASVLIAGPVAVFNASQLFGLDTSTGQIVWSGDPELTKGTHASPVCWKHDGQSYVLSIGKGGNVVCLDPASGQILWAVEADGGHASPIVKGDKLLVYGNSRKKGLRCFTLRPDGAETLWLFQRVTDKGSTPVVTDTHVYVQGERKVACVDLETGSQQWTGNLDMANPQWSSPIGAGDVGFYAYDGLVAFRLTPDAYEELFAARMNKEFLMANDEHYRAEYGLDNDELDAEERKKAYVAYEQNVGKQGPLKCSTPAFDNGFLYLRTADNLICYDLRRTP